jgi:hypothetical protein
MAAGRYTDPLQSSPPNSPRGAHGGDARSIANEAKEVAKERASAVWNDTKDSARSLLSEQQRAAASGVEDFAAALRKAASEMGDGGQANMSRVIESAASGLERFSGSLRNKDLNSLVQDVESFARRQPVAFFGAAVAAGFLAMRFLKSSNEPGHRAEDVSGRDSRTGSNRDFSTGTRDYTSGTPF